MSFVLVLTGLIGLRLIHIDEQRELHGLVTAPLVWAIPETEVRRLEQRHPTTGQIAQDLIASVLNQFMVRLRKNKVHLLQEKTFENNTAKHANSHLAMMGKPGVGKTQFLLKLLVDIRIQSNYQTNFVYFDYKGDVVDNERFLEIARVQPYRLLQAGQSLPINPFVLPAFLHQLVVAVTIRAVHLTSLQASKIRLSVAPIKLVQADTWGRGETVRDR